MKTFTKLLAGFLFCTIVVYAWADRPNYQYGNDLSCSALGCGTLTVDTAFTASGTSNMTTATIGAATITTMGATAGTVATLGSTTATITTLGATVGTITTLGSTTANLATANLTDAVIATSLTNNGIHITVSDAVGITSPTVTFSAGGKDRIDLTTDASQTGIYPTGGTLGQEIIVYGTSDSNTLRFDDGTSMTIGGNITLGIGDTLGLRCVSADGDEWLRNFSSDN